VVLGPFEVVHDVSVSYWQGLKVVVGGITSASMLCHMTNKGDGGIYLLKLWSVHDRRYEYRGDPNGVRYIPPDTVIQVLQTYLSAEYHVGFVEDKEAQIRAEAMIQQSQNYLHNEQEALRREQFGEKR
jgi:hypothetical protein